MRPRSGMAGFSFMICLWGCMWAAGVSAAEAQGVTGEAAQTSQSMARLMREKRPPADVAALLRERIGRVPQGQRDALVQYLVEYQQERLRDFDNRFQKVYDAGRDAFDPKFDRRPGQLNLILGVRDARVREALVELRRNGYRVNYTEGIPFLDMDFRPLLDAFLGDLSDEYKEVLLIEAREAEDMAYDDNGRIVDPDEVASRLAATVDFRSLWPKSRFGGLIRNYEALYWRLYLVGVNNTPVFDFDSGKVEAEMKISYEKSLWLYEHRPFGKVMEAYMELLTQAEWKRTKDAERFIRTRTTGYAGFLDHFYSSGGMWGLREDLVPAEMTGDDTGVNEFTPGRPVD